MTSSMEKPCEGDEATDDEAIRTCTDDEISSLVADLQAKSKTRYPYSNSDPFEPPGLRYNSGPQGTRISQGYVLRSVREVMISFLDVKAGVDLARKLGVRTPAMVRAFRDYSDPQSRGYTKCIYTYIPGESLADLMPRIDMEETVRLAFQLRGMLKIMHQQTNEYAGSVHHLRFNSWSKFQHGDDCGLPTGSTTATDIARVANFWYAFRRDDYVRPRPKTPEEIEGDCKNGPVPDSLPIVFTHYNLVPKNIIRDKNGDIWLINWNYAGWYPACFEGAGMKRFHHWRYDGWTLMTRLRWRIFCSIANNCKWGKEADAVSHAERGGVDCIGARKWSVQLGITRSKNQLRITRYPGHLPV